MPANFTPAFLLLSRIFLSLMFVTAGYQKIGGYAAMQGYMEAMGVPGALLPLVILLEIIGGLAVLAGFQTRLAAFLLAGFTLVAGYLFHYVAAAGDASGMQMILFWKNVSIAGGFLALVATGAGAWSIDQKLSKKATLAAI